MYGLFFKGTANDMILEANLCQFCFKKQGGYHPNDVLGFGRKAVRLCIS